MIIIKQWLADWPTLTVGWTDRWTDRNIHYTQADNQRCRLMDEVGQSI